MCLLLFFKYTHSKLFPRSERSLTVKQISRAAWARFFTTSLALCVICSFALICLKEPIHNFVDDVPQEKLTIRVNTFRRMDLLEVFLDHYTTCIDTVDNIQVVWSDQVNQAPLDWEAAYTSMKVKFEVHSTNSLSNRFKALSEIATTAVLSIDDDLVIPCADLRMAMSIWQSNRKALVGFSPRMTTYDVETGQAKYGRWQHTWWNGKYTLMLTKVCIMHKGYLKSYVDLMPVSVLEYIEKNRNCEDLAIAHLASQLSGLPPVWVSGTIFETGITGGGISSGGSHFATRGHCLDFLQHELGPISAKIISGQVASPVIVREELGNKLTNDWPWVIGEQRAVPIGINSGDLWGLQDLYSLMWK